MLRPVAGSSVSAAEARVPSHRLLVQRIRRGDEISEAEPSTILQPGDVVAISGPRQALVELLGTGATEVEDRPAGRACRDRSALLTNPELVGRTLAEAAQGEWTRNLYLRAMTRGGVEIPLAPRITLERGDTCMWSGPRLS